MRWWGLTVVLASACTGPVTSGPDAGDASACADGACEETTSTDAGSTDAGNAPDLCFGQPCDQPIAPTCAWTTEHRAPRLRTGRFEVPVTAGWSNATELLGQSGTEEGIATGTVEDLGDGALALRDFDVRFPTNPEYRWRVLPAVASLPSPLLSMDSMELLRTTRLGGWFDPDPYYERESANVRWAGTTLVLSSTWSQTTPNAPYSSRSADITLPPVDASSLTTRVPCVTACAPGAPCDPCALEVPYLASGRCTSGRYNYPALMRYIPSLYAGEEVRITQAALAVPRYYALPTVTSRFAEIHTPDGAAPFALQYDHRAFDSTHRSLLVYERGACHTPRYAVSVELEWGDPVQCTFDLPGRPE